MPPLKRIDTDTHTDELAIAAECRRALIASATGEVVPLAFARAVVRVEAERGRAGLDPLPARVAA